MGQLKTLVGYGSFTDGLVHHWCVVYVKQDKHRSLQLSYSLKKRTNKQSDHHYPRDVIHCHQARALGALNISVK